MLNISPFFDRQYKVYSENVKSRNKLHYLIGLYVRWKQHFWGCSGLTSIVIGNGIKRLPTYVFGGCTSLSSIIIPANVETIETKAFKDCSALKEIHVKNPLPPTVYDAFSTYSHVVLYVPIGSKEAYQNHSIWGKFSTIIEE